MNNHKTDASWETSHLRSNNDWVFTITKAEKKQLLTKNGINKKTISISKSINVQTNGLVLLDYKILGNESKES